MIKSLRKFHRKYFTFNKEGVKIKFSFRKLFTFRKCNDSSIGTYYRNDWISFYPKFDHPSFKIEKSGYFDVRPYLICTLTTMIGLFGMLLSPFFGWTFFFIMFGVVLFIPWGSLYMSLPINTDIETAESPSWGFYFYGEGKRIPDSLVILRGEKSKYIYLPWAYDWVRTSYLRDDNGWEHETKGSRGKNDWWDKQKWAGVLYSERYPYIYTLKNGDLQYPMATVGVSEREWRPRWFKWTPLFKKVRRTIDVEFDEEVGERSGSYKGGTLGCGYELLPDETPKQCLYRMENERKF